MISLFNMIGRFVWASSSDYLGRRNTYWIFFALGIALYLSIPWVARQVSVDPAAIWLVYFYAATMIIFTMYGGGFATIPAYLADMFGTRYVGGIHGRLLTAWSLAGVLGPVAITMLRERSIAAAIRDLVPRIDAERFRQAFGAGVEQLDALVAQQTVTIAKLMEIAPPGTIDPTPSLYNLDDVPDGRATRHRAGCERAHETRRRETSHGRSAGRGRTMTASTARTLALATVAALAAGCANESPPAASSASRPLTLDTHIDIPLDYATAATDPLTAELQVNLAKMSAGGLDAGFFIVFVGQTVRNDDGYARAQADALTKFDAIHRMAEQLYPERIELAYSSADVPRIAAAGKLVAAIGIENGYSLGRNLEMLERYHELGARYLGLVHDGDNDLARSARPRPELGDPAVSTAGVTALGAEAIARANRLGLMVDVSHGSKQTALDAMRLSAAPVVASHSGIAAVNAHPRNMDDETLLALKADGGVVQVVAYDAYLKQQPEEKTTALRELRERVGITATSGVRTLPPDRRALYDDGLRELEARWPAATAHSGKSP